MNASPKLSFRYRLEQEKPRLGPGGITRGASVHEFPASKGIAGVSMRLEAGAMRELHWHANAAEWGYVVSGNCRTTILHPEGSGSATRSETDTFGPGDVWYFPRGWGHSIQGVGPGECHFILIFDNGDFSEDHTFSVTDCGLSIQKPVFHSNEINSLCRKTLAVFPRKSLLGNGWETLCLLLPCVVEIPAALIAAKTGARLPSASNPCSSD